MGIVALIILLIVGFFIVSALAGVVFSLFVPVLIWAIIGWLAGQIIRGQGYGAVNNILLGIGGGIVGSILFRLLNLGFVDNIWVIGNIVVGVVGALVLIWLVRTFSDNKSFGR